MYLNIRKLAFITFRHQDLSIHHDAVIAPYCFLAAIGNAKFAVDYQESTGSVSIRANFAFSVDALYRNVLSIRDFQNSCRVHGHGIFVQQFLGTLIDDQNRGIDGDILIPGKAFFRYGSCIAGCGIDHFVLFHEIRPPLLFQFFSQELSGTAQSSPDS